MATALDPAPVTTTSDPEAFELLRRRSGPIAKWFDYTCGWTLVAEPRLGYLRLMKVGEGQGVDASRPARRNRSGRTPFDRRRYTLFCVVAAEVLLLPVTTIGILADRVTQACAVDDALPAFDTAVRSERMAFVDVIRWFESSGIFTSVDGATDQFVDAADAKVLYRVNGALLGRLLVATIGFTVAAEDIPAQFDALVQGLLVERRYGDPDADLDAGTAGATEVQRNLWLRHSILRRLFDDPVVYRFELSQAQLDYLASPTGRRILANAVDQAGFALEERSEGWLLVDLDGVATDSRFPDSSSTAKTAALVLLDWLLARPDGASSSQLEAAAATILVKAPGWAKIYRSEDGAKRLASDAVEVLVDFALARRDDGRCFPLPAAARYRSAVVSGDDGFDDSEGLW